MKEEGDVIVGAEGDELVIATTAVVGVVHIGANVEKKVYGTSSL